MLTLYAERGESKMTDLFKVEKKVEFRRVVNGEIETCFRIWATSQGGTYFHVVVKEDELSKSNAILTARAKQLDSI